MKSFLHVCTRRIQGMRAHYVIGCADNCTQTQSLTICYALHHKSITVVSPRYDGNVGSRTDKYQKVTIEH